MCHGETIVAQELTLGAVRLIHDQAVCVFLAGPCILPLHDFRAGRSRHARRVVSAVISDYQQPVAWLQLNLGVFERRNDGGALVGRGRAPTSWSSRRKATIAAKRLFVAFKLLLTV